MTQQQFFFNRFNRRNGWYGLIIMVIVLVLLFFLVKSIFNILYYLSPLLLVLTLLFDYKVIVKFLSWWWKLFKSNWIYGLGVAILSGIGFPILTGGLFINAFMNWRVKRAKKKQGKNK